ncbi:MAG: MFS transporter [Acidimicrobiales bacterium]
MSTTPDQTAAPLRFGRLVGTSIGTKLLNDTSVQIFNPYLPVIAAGLGVDVVALGRLVGLRSLMGLAAPVGGAIGERRSFRTVVCWSLLVGALGLGLVGAAGGDGVGYGVLVLGMILSGLGIAGFVPSLQAYASSHLPYTRRARGMGMIEYSWALTGIVTLFLAGRLIEATTWRLPFVLLAGLMVVAAVVFARLPKEDRPGAGVADGAVAAAEAMGEPIAGLAVTEVVDAAGRQAVALAAQPPARKDTGPLRFLWLGPGSRSAYAEIVAGGLLYFAAMQVLLVHGLWLADQYGLNAAGLGTVALVFGLFDLLASVSVSLFVDRVGKRRSVLGGMVAGVVAYLLLPVVDSGLATAVAGLTLARCIFEFTIVSHFPLLSEQLPAQRGRVLTLATSAGLLFSTAAGFVGPWLYQRSGIAAVAMVSAATMAIAGALVAALVREPAG